MLIKRIDWNSLTPNSSKETLPYIEKEEDINPLWEECDEPNDSSCTHEWGIPTEWVDDDGFSSGLMKVCSRCKDSHIWVETSHAEPTANVPGFGWMVI